MEPDAADRIARALVAARRSQSSIKRFPAECGLRSLEDAYQVQDRTLELLGGATDGWYCAATSKEIQAASGLPGPYCAPLFAGTVRRSPAVLSAAEFPVIAWECEFAFRLRRDLPPLQGGYARTIVADAIHEVHPVIEVLTSRLRNWREQPVLNRLADNGSDGAVVHGDGIERWRDIDLAAVEVRLAINGRPIARGCGANALGHPLEAMTWLVNALGARGVTMRREQLFNTGTVTGMHLGRHDDVAVADFGPLGSVSARFGA